MDNFINSSLNVTSPLSGPSFLVFNVVMLLGVVLPVIVANTVILVALILETSIVSVIRLVLGSILVSCLLSALGLAMNHIAGINLNLLPLNNPPNLPCTITTFLIAFGGAARLMFMAAFAVIVYIIVKFGETAKKHLVVTVLVMVAVLWVLSFLGASPLLSQGVVHTRYEDSLSCGPDPINVFSYVYVGLYVLLFGVVTLTVTITFLIITICYLKQHTIPDAKVKKAIVKFGFFSLLGNGINILGLVVPPLIAAFVDPPKDTAATTVEELIYTAYVLLNAALIPTPILVIIYFTPIQKRLRHCLCCCCGPNKDKHVYKSSNVEGSNGTHGTEIATNEI